MLISTAYAQTGPAAAPAAGGAMTLSGLLPFILMFVAIYFIMIRPQMKRQKEQRTMIDALALGDEVLTIGGVTGKISKLDAQYIKLEVAPGVEVNLQRSAVAQVLPKGSIQS